MVHARRHVRVGLGLSSIPAVADVAPRAVDRRLRLDRSQPQHLILALLVRRRRQAHGLERVPQGAPIFIIPVVIRREERRPRVDAPGARPVHLERRAARRDLRPEPRQVALALAEGLAHEGLVLGGRREVRGLVEDIFRVLGRRLRRARQPREEALARGRRRGRRLGVVVIIIKADRAVGLGGPRAGRGDAEQRAPRGGRGLRGQRRLALAEGAAVAHAARRRRGCGHKGGCLLGFLGHGCGCCPLLPCV
mmetsp:Transcript_9369/g.27426  ORF Transcript_9369/g.27426 Transcript_9369/m.27426 type:complete len:250 (-) Transcript_9369:36-785(-)